MKTSEEIDFEQFCQKNGVKPTNMKADYYLAGYFKGQQRMIEKACEWLQQNTYTFFTCDTDEVLDFVNHFKEAMEE